MTTDTMKLIDEAQAVGAANGWDMREKLIYLVERATKTATRAALAQAPAWQDAPTVPGLWLCDEGDICYQWRVNNIEILDVMPDDEVRWYGPIPPNSEDK